MMIVVIIMIISHRLMCCQHVSLLSRVCIVVRALPVKKWRSHLPASRYRLRHAPATPASTNSWRPKIDTSVSVAVVVCTSLACLPSWHLTPKPKTTGAVVVLIIRDMRTGTWRSADSTVRPEVIRRRRSVSSVSSQSSASASSPKTKINVGDVPERPPNVLGFPDFCRKRRTWATRQRRRLCRGLQATSRSTKECRSLADFVVR